MFIVLRPPSIVHGIGKNLVVMMLEGGRFEVVDLGIDVPAEKFIEAIKQHEPQAVGMYALLTTTMREMKNTIPAFEGSGIRNQVKVIVGSAPVTWRETFKPGLEKLTQSLKSIRPDIFLLYKSTLTLRYESLAPGF